jgi:alkanesulfonate monooxygenase SsuD/methylene tetrahydromethanopterin reductase-like flavin-dependent oxidoreductase (luciferase family)
MKFYVSPAFLETREVVELAKAADDLGYDGFGIPDHVVNLEKLATPYPCTKDGERRWQPFTGMRDPYSVAKAVGTAAYLAGGRVELGVGVGWCEEESR